MHIAQSIEPYAPDETEWCPPEQGEDEDYVEYLGRKADYYATHQPPTPPGMRLIECTATPRHWPSYETDDEDFYPGPCQYCMYESLRQELNKLERRDHRRKHPILLRGPFARWIVSRLSTLGVIASYGTHFGGATECKWCIDGIRFRGKRSYILGWPTWKWGCLFKGRHWPGEYVCLDMCGKCLPCPDCDSTSANCDCSNG